MSLMNNNLRFVLWYPFGFLIALIMKLISPLFAKTRRNKNAPWVIGGHRGRIYADNSAALHDYIASKTSQPIVWIATDPLYRELKLKKMKVLKKDSLKAKLAILRAPVLIFSHGLDDIDTFLKKIDVRTGKRIFLFHTLTFLKKAIGKPENFDFLLAVSEEEKKNMSHMRDINKILPYGGGAHLDRILELRKVEPQNLILWFPTWRDTKDEQLNAFKVMAEIIGSKKLHDFLERENLHLAIINHINASSNFNLHFTNNNSLDSRISLHKPTEIIDFFAKAKCFISDYSGTIFDWLALDRPAIFFPFDEQAYIKNRDFFYELSQAYYGPVAHTIDEFMDILLNKKWENTEPYLQKREMWKNKIFSTLEPVYSKKCYETIEGLL